MHSQNHNIVKRLRYLLICIFIMSLSSILMSQSPDFTGLKVMINPGHGGNDSNDRGMPNGFWESESNLTKGLWLRDILEERNCDVIMSRVLNRTEDDLPLSQIAGIANDNNVDLFISIHSNAGNQTSNYPMPIFNGKTETPAIPAAKEWARILWEHLITNEATYWTNTSPRYIGDLTLNPTFTFGYGVLYPLVVPGIISEGSFHDYQPEVDRLLNLEYRKQEAWNIYYAMVEYFQLPGLDDFGNITGLVRDSFLINKTNTHINSPDRYLPVDGVLVEILETSEQYLVDNNNSGFFYFDSIPPGDYRLKFSALDYFTDTIDVTVKKHQITYSNYWIKADKTMPPKIVSISPEDNALISCFDPVELNFNMNMDSASFAKAFSVTPATSGAFFWDEDYLNVSFLPDIPYETNTGYEVKIDSNAMHKWGVKIGVDTLFRFSTDNRNRYLIEKNFPANNQTEISPYLQFRVIFDEALNNSTLINAVSIIPEEGDPLSTKGASISTIEGKGHYYFYPSSDLEYNKSYTLKINGSVQDVNNIPLVEDKLINFSTGSAPGVLSILEECDDANKWSIDFTNSIAVNAINSFLFKWTKIFRSGTASMLIRYDFESETAEMIIKPDAEIEMINSENIALWVWGELSLNEIFIGFDDGSEAKLCEINFAGWKYCQTSLPDGATKVTYIKLKRSALGAAGGDLYIDALNQINTTSFFGKNLAGFKVYPNPVSGDIIQIEGIPKGAAGFEIYSLESRLLQKGKLDSNTIKIDRNNIKSGMIILRISIDNQEFNALLTVE
jgi:N-acetylmuramoyl-L-alanine amidase